MIETTGVKLTFAYDAIDRGFAIFRVQRDQQEWASSLIPDAALQECRALAASYEYGGACYLLYHRQEAERRELRRQLETYDEQVRVTELSARRVDDRHLAQLLCNAIPALISGESLYHNITGHLYYQRREWQYLSRGMLWAFWVLDVCFTEDGCLKLGVKTFSSVKLHKDAGKKTRYCLDPRSYWLRRVLPGESLQGELYLQKAPPSGKKRWVTFLDFDTIGGYRSCKVGVLDRFLEDVEIYLQPYLLLELRQLEESHHRGFQKADQKQESVRQRLRSYRVCVEDTIDDPASRDLIRRLGEELRLYSGVELLEEPHAPGDLLLRVIHEPDYYKEQELEDPHEQAPRDCVVQHVTLESFLKREQKKQKEHSELRKVLQELAVKADVLERQVTCYDWTAREYRSPVTFVMAEQKQKEGTQVFPIRYKRLRISPEGAMTFDSWQSPVPPTDRERLLVSAPFVKKNGVELDRTVRGIVYRDPEALQVIRDTDCMTLPNRRELEAVLQATDPDELLPVEPLRLLAEEHLRDCAAKERPVLEQMLEALSRLGKEAHRAELKPLVHLKSKLGQTLNRELREQYGILLGDGKKQEANRERIFGGMLDIRLFREGEDQCYYSGVPGGALQRTLENGNCIRRVSSPNGEADFAPYMPLLEVDFVRSSTWTVLPFPFKYLREWKPEA